MVFAADLGIFCNGIARGKLIASLVPQETFILF
jgi:hypothetical protein